jgi:hypothetical protein
LLRTNACAFYAEELLVGWLDGLGRACLFIFWLVGLLREGVSGGFKLVVESCEGVGQNDGGGCEIQKGCFGLWEWRVGGGFCYVYGYVQVPKVLLSWQAQG